MLNGITPTPRTFASAANKNPGAMAGFGSDRSFGKSHHRPVYTLRIADCLRERVAQQFRAGHRACYFSYLSGFAFQLSRLLIGRQRTCDLRCPMPALVRADVERTCSL